MRLLLALIAVLLASCGGRTASTVISAPPPAAAAPVDARARAPAAPRPVTVAPVYPDARPMVFLACQRAALAYLGHVDEEDAAAGRLMIHDHNGWWGDSDVEVRLAAAGDATRVDVLVTSRSLEWLQDREHMVLSRYLARLEIEMRTVRGLRTALAADQAPTVAGSAISGASATSRP